MTTPAQLTRRCQGRLGYRHLLLIMACILLLFPVSGGNTEASPSSPAPSAIAGTFVVAGPGYDGVTLDPALATDGPSLLIARQVYDTLLEYQEGGTFPVAGLAQDWDVSSDGLTWTFHLRPGVRFHDGSDLDAAAVVANINRWWDPANPWHNGDFTYFGALFGGFKGDPNCLITAVSASGASDVVIGLRTPFSPLLSVIAFPAFSIASPAAIAGGALETTPVGSGPFAFVERIPGDRVTLAANPTYWGGTPRSDTLVFRAITSAVERLDALKAGDVQVADSMIEGQGDPLVRLLTRGSTNVGYLGINRAHGPLDNPLVRQAMAHLVDKPRLLAMANYGLGQVADQFLPVGNWGRDGSITGYRYDPTLARALLAQAGYGSGFTTTLAYRNVFRDYMADPPAVAQMLKTDFALAGITLDLVELPSATLLERVDSGEVDLFLLGWGADYPHPDNYFRWHFCGTWKSLLPQDTELCAVLQDALVSSDLAEQEAMYQWVSRRVHDTVPVVPLFNGGTLLARRYDVTGVTPSPLGIESYRFAEVIPEGSATVTPDAGGSVGYLQGDTFTSLQVPPEAVSQAVVVQISPTVGPPAIPTGLAGAGHDFDIETIQRQLLLEGLPLNKPATLNVEYADSDVLRIREDSLALYVWDGANWSPAVDTCTPPSSAVLDKAGNQIMVPVCHLSRFALFGTPVPPVYLPLTLR